MDGSLPASAGDTGSIPSRKDPHTVEQPDPWATAAKAHMPSECAPHQEKALQRETHSLRPRAAPSHSN